MPKIDIANRLSGAMQAAANNDKNNVKATSLLAAEDRVVKQTSNNQSTQTASKQYTPANTAQIVKRAPYGMEYKNGQLQIKEGYEADPVTGFVLPTTQTVLKESALDDILSIALKNTGASYLNIGGQLAGGEDHIKQYDKTSGPLIGQSEAVKVNDTELYDPVTGFILPTTESIIGSREELYEKADKLAAEAAEQTGKAKEGKNAVEQFLIDAGIAGVNLAGDIALNTVAPGLGWVNMAARGYGSGSQQARQEGATGAQQFFYGLGTAGIEILTEKLGNIAAPLKKAFGKGLADNVVSKAISKLTSSEAGQRALTFLASGASEGAEEMVSDILEPLLRRATYDKQALESYKDDEFWSDTIRDGLIGGALGLVAGSGGLVNRSSTPSTTQANADAQAAQPTAQTTVETQAETTATQPRTVADIISSGNVSNNVANTIIENPQLKAEFEAISGTKLTGTKSEQRTFIKSFAAQMSQDVASQTQQNITPAEQATQAQAQLPTQTPTEAPGTAQQPQSVNVPQTAQQATTQEFNGQIGQTELPNSVGAAAAGFGVGRSPEYVPTQSKTTENIPQGYTPAPHIRQRVSDNETRAAERLAVDYAGEMADLRVRQGWDATDEATAQAIKRDLVAKAYQTGDFSDVVRWNRVIERYGTQSAQQMRQRQEYVNDPETFVANAADTLAKAEGYEDSSTQDRKDISKTAAETEKAVKKAATDASKELGTLKIDSAASGAESSEAQKVGAAVAKALDASTSAKAQQNALQSVYNTLKRFAREKLPQTQKSKSATAIDLMRVYVQNQEFYAEAWQEAQAQLREKYGDTLPAALSDFVNTGIGVDSNISPQNKIFLAALTDAAMQSGETRTVIATQEALGFTNMAQNIANYLIRETGATGEMEVTIADAAQTYVNNILSQDRDTTSSEIVNSKIKSALRDIGTTISKLVKQTSQQKSSVQEAVTQLLIDKYGIGSVEATNVADTVNQYFNSLVEQQTEKTLSKMFSERPESQKTTFYQKLQDMLNMGAFDRASYAQAAAEAMFGGNAKVTKPKFLQALNNVKDFSQRLSEIPENDTQSTIQLIKDISEVRRTSGLFSKKTSSIMNAALEYYAGRPDGAEFLRQVASSQIYNIAADYTGLGALEAVKSYRINSMLSKIATTVRNIVSNITNGAVEVLSNNVSVPIDMMLSHFTGTRTVPVDRGAFSSAAWRGLADGAIRSFIQVGLDADVDSSVSKYGVRPGRTFKMTGNVLERFMSTWSKYINYALRTTDEASKGMIRGEYTRALNRLAEKGKVDPAIIPSLVEETALQRTFQNEGAVANAITDIKRGLNRIGINTQKGSFGLGDVASPFAKVLGNIAEQKFNYTPLGGIKTFLQLIGNLGNIKNANLTPEAQSRIAINFGRSITGTAASAAFAMLALKGLLKISDDDDDDWKRLDSSEGLSDTQVNISAVGRWLNGESTQWQAGDTLMSVSFLEPLNVNMSLGVLAAEEYVEKNGFDSIWDVADTTLNTSIEAMYQSLSELSLLQFVQDVEDAIDYAEGEKPAEIAGDAILSYLGSQASSMVPNFVRGIAQGLDPYYRNQYAGDSTAQDILNQLKYAIPGARETLPLSYDNWGNVREYGNSDIINFLNANVLPGYVNTYTPDPVTEFLRASDYSAPKRNAPTSFTMDKKEVVLDNEQKTKYQKTYGDAAYSVLDDMRTSQLFSSLDKEAQNEAVDKAYEYATALAKASVSSYEPQSWVSEAQNARSVGLDVATYIAVYGKVSDIKGKKESSQPGASTITNSQGLKRLQYLYSLDLTDDQRIYLAEAFDVGKTVRYYTEDEVNAALAEMGYLN